jgi:hypothetical protein
MAMRTRAQEKAAFAKKRTTKAPGKHRVPVSATAKVLFSTGGHRVVLDEDAKAVGDRVYALHDEKGSIGFLGKELQSFVEWWPTERSRKGLLPGLVFRSLPHHEHFLRVIRDEPEFAPRVYEIEDYDGAITIQGRHLNRVLAWWLGEQKRRGKDSADALERDARARGL